MLRQHDGAARARSEPMGGVARRRLSIAANEVAKAPERLFGDEKMARAKSQQQRLSHWVMKTPKRTILAYCCMPAAAAFILVGLYATAPTLAALLEGLLRLVVSSASVVVAARLWAARQVAPPQQQRDEQLWITLCLVMYAIRFEPVTWALYDSRLLSLWPVACVRRSIAQGSVYVTMMFMTSVLGQLSRRGGPPAKAGSWIQTMERSHVRMLAVCWVCSEIFTNQGLHSIAPYAISNLVVIVGCVTGVAWFCITVRFMCLAMQQMEWSDAAAKPDRLFLVILMSLIGMLVGAQFFVRRGKHNISAKMAGLCALQFLFMLTHVFWPSNLSTTGEAAVDFGV
jgi:hypothetical protein